MFRNSSRRRNLSIPDDCVFDINRGSAVYAHPLIRRVMEHVKILENQWADIRQDRIEDERIWPIEQVICKLSGTNVNAGISNTAFRYFCAARIFAKYIYKMFEQKWDPTFKNNGKNEFSKLDELNITEELGDLKELAERMLPFLNLNSPRKETAGDESDGKRASLASPGSIPFMLVFSDPKTLVYFRRNIELINRKTTISNFVGYDDEKKLCDLPLFVTENGRPVPGYLRNQTLKDVIPDKSMRKKLLDNKWITQLHVEISGTQVKYEFDFTDFELRMDPSKTINEQKLRNLAGVDRVMDWSLKNEEHFRQEDIKFEIWNDKLIRSVIDEAAAPEGSSTKTPNFRFCRKETTKESHNSRTGTSSESSDIMYLGFCFKTIIDAGYADDRFVQGSTNILLMALTRGFVQLAKNSERTSVFMGKEINDYLEENRNKHNNKYKDETLLFKPGMRRRRIHYNHPHFFGASSKGITVRTKVPIWFFLLFGTSIIGILLYGILVGRSQAHDPNWAEYSAGLIALTSALLAVSLFITKIIYASWDFTEMFHQRRNAKSLAQIQAVVKGGYETALEVCSLIENPEEVFSKSRSCAFVHEGLGEFEIDEDIYVNDLLRIGARKAQGDETDESFGFIFGLDYYGSPIVCDMLGRIRQVEFPKPVCEKCNPLKPFKSFAELCDHYDNNKCTSSDREKNLFVWIFCWIHPANSFDKSWFHLFPKKRFSEAGYIHIGAKHDLDTEYLFALPTINLGVGSGINGSSRYTSYENAIVTRENDEMV